MITRRQFLRKLGLAAAAVPVAAVLPMPKLAEGGLVTQPERFTVGDRGIYTKWHFKDTLDNVHVDKTLTNFSTQYMPTYHFDSDTDTGLFFADAGNLKFQYEGRAK